MSPVLAFSIVPAVYNPLSSPLSHNWVNCCQLDSKRTWWTQKLGFWVLTVCSSAVVAPGYKALKPSEEDETSSLQLINFLDLTYYNSLLFKMSSDHHWNVNRSLWDCTVCWLYKASHFARRPGHHAIIARYLHNETSVKTGLALMVSTSSTIGDYGSHTSYPVSSPPRLTTTSSYSSWEEQT